MLKEYTKGNPAAMVEIMQVLKQKNLIHTINSNTLPDARIKREFIIAREDDHDMREHRPGEGYVSSLASWAAVEQRMYDVMIDAVHL